MCTMLTHLSVFHGGPVGFIGEVSSTMERDPLPTHAYTPFFKAGDSRLTIAWAARLENDLLRLSRHPREAGKPYPSRRILCLVRSVRPVQYSVYSSSFELNFQAKGGLGFPPLPINRRGFQPKDL